MKKIFAIVLGAALMLAGTNAFAQFSAGAGWINSTERETYKTNDPEKTNLNGFYAGGQYNLPIVGGLSVAPGLYASMLFGKQTGNLDIYGVSLGSGEVKSTEFAINVPINFNYAIEVGDFKVFAYVGPIFQYGFVNKDTLDGTLVGVNIHGTTNNYTGVTVDKDGNKIDLLSGDPTRAPFNVYIGGGAGIQAGNFQVILGYDHSLTNLCKVDGYKLSRSEIKIGVGYAF